MPALFDAYTLRSNDNLKAKVSAALAVKAAALIGLATPTARQIAWAYETVADPDARAGAFLNYLIGLNAAAPAANITGAADATIQAAVNAAVDKLVA